MGQTGELLVQAPGLFTHGQQVRGQWLQRGILSVMAMLIVAGFASTYLFG